MSFKGAVILFTLGLVSVRSAEAAPTDSLRAEVSNEKVIVYHQVEEGETIYSLSKRYQTSSAEIIADNDIRNNTIDIGQVLKIPYGGEAKNKIIRPADGSNPETGSEIAKFHTVAPGETLFSISRTYGVSVADLKEWNNLADNAISVGQKIALYTENIREGNEEEKQQNLLRNAGYKYVVRSGDNLRGIARKFEVSVDSIKAWNGLSSNKIALGQELYFPFSVESEREKRVNEVEDYRKSGYGSKIKAWSDGGVTKVVEEGVAKVIEGDMHTSNYLALHRKLNIGSVLQVKNLMNNEKIYVRVVGKLPDTGVNQNTMIRLTPVAFEKLGIIDQKALVEIIYFQQ